MFKPAEIRYRSSQPIDALPVDHNYTSTSQVEKSPDEFDQLYAWLIEQLKSSESPISMSDTLAKYKELTK